MSELYKNLAHDQALYAFEGRNNMPTAESSGWSSGMWKGFNAGFDAGWDAAMKVTMNVEDGNR